MRTLASMRVEQCLRTGRTRPQPRKRRAARAPPSRAARKQARGELLPARSRRIGGTGQTGLMARKPIPGRRKTSRLRPMVRVRRENVSRGPYQAKVSRRAATPTRMTRRSPSSLRRVELSRVGLSCAEPSRAGPSRAGPSRARGRLLPSRAEAKRRRTSPSAASAARQDTVTTRAGGMVVKATSNIAPCAICTGMMRLGAGGTSPRISRVAICVGRPDMRKRIVGGRGGSGAMSVVGWRPILARVLGNRRRADRSRARARRRARPSGSSVVVKTTGQEKEVIREGREARAEREAKVLRLRRWCRLPVQRKRRLLCRSRGASKWKLNSPESLLRLKPSI
mmetsp:Transcript_26914/g.60734  ORF Transcript_26914/g.60734 Transcript_26914/m.60734 type:complete len:338 (-) Transcript_26914:1319-2332(-)